VAVTTVDDFASCGTITCTYYSCAVFTHTLSSS